MLGFLRAVNEARTRDPQLGKLMLYQLSYCRILLCLTGANIHHFSGIASVSQEVFHAGYNPATGTFSLLQGAHLCKGLVTNKIALQCKTCDTQQPIDWGHAQASLR